MARAVFYKGDKLFTFAKRVQDGFDYFDILLFMMTCLLYTSDAADE